MTELVQQSGAGGLCRERRTSRRVFINDDESGHADYERWLEGWLPHEPIEQYRHNDTGEDNADAHMKRQVMGREVVVAITKAATFRAVEQISTANSTAAVASVCWSKLSAPDATFLLAWIVLMTGWWSVDAAPAVWGIYLISQNLMIHCRSKK